MSAQIQYPNNKIDSNGHEWATIGENIRYGQRLSTLIGKITGVELITLSKSGSNYTISSGYSFTSTDGSIARAQGDIIMATVVAGTGADIDAGLYQKIKTNKIVTAFTIPDPLLSGESLTLAISYHI